VHPDTGGVSLQQTTTKDSQHRRVPKIAVLLMLIIVVCLAMLAVFANAQRFRRGYVEVVIVKPISSPTPQATER
jgi:predicted small integral membrane protein